MTKHRLKLVKEKSEQARTAEQSRDHAIRFAFDAKARRDFGYTVDDIAEAAGLSRPRIYQIVKEADDA